MITTGVDAHKRVHAAYAVDDAGRELGQWRGPNSAAGWRGLAEWSHAFTGDRRWVIEGAWGYGRNLAQSLVGDGESVFEVNARWTAFGRRRGRRPSKSDSLDARAVALVARQEAPGLPIVTADDETAILDALRRRMTVRLRSTTTSTDGASRRALRQMVAHRPFTSQPRIITATRPTC